MLSCTNEVGTVVEAIRQGAQDYITKPFEKSELDAAMLKCQQKRKLREENKTLAGILRHDHRGSEFPGGESADGAHPPADFANCPGGRASLH